MSKLSFESYPHESELSFGMDIGYSKRWGNLRFSVSFFTKTYYLCLDWEGTNV